MQTTTEENGAVAVAPRTSDERLAAARAAVADKLKPIPQFSYGRVIVARDALQQLAKIGSNSRDIVERLTQMIRYAAAVADSFDQQRDAFSNYYALVDSDSQQILTREIELPGQGKTTVPVYKNEVEFQLLMNDLMRDDASKNTALGDPPRPFTYAELRSTNWAKKPDPALIARLGPFVDMSTKPAAERDRDEGER